MYWKLHELDVAACIPVTERFEETATVARAALNADALAELTLTSTLNGWPTVLVPLAGDASIFISGDCSSAGLFRV